MKEYVNINFDKKTMRIEDKEQVYHSYNYQALGLVFQPIIDYFNNTEFAEKPVSVLYNNREWFGLGLKFKNINADSLIPVLVNAGSFFSQTRPGFNSSTDPCGFRIIPLSSRCFKTVDNDSLESLIGKDLRPYSHEAKLRADYIEFEHFIFDHERGFNQYPLHNIRIVYPPKLNDVIKLVNSIEFEISRGMAINYMFK